MRIIKGTLQGKDAYFVGATSNNAFAWSPDIENAHPIKDEDVEEVLSHLKENCGEIINMHHIAADNIGYVYAVEFAYIIETLDEIYGDTDLTKKDAFKVRQSFADMVDAEDYPEEYLAGIDIDIVEGRVIIGFPADGNIIRIRTLH